MRHTNKTQHEPDTETIVECLACEKRFLERNQGYHPGSEWGDDPRCPFCGTVIEGEGIDTDRFDVLVGERQTLRFEGGVRADIRLSGDEELTPHVARELERAVDTWRERFTGSDGTWGGLTSRHQQRVLEELPEPLNMLVCELVSLNGTKFLEDGAMADTYGAEQIREQGLTANQRHWIETIAQNLEEADD